MLKTDFNEMKLKDCETIAKEVVDILIKNNIYITTMESCTGGALISEITNVPGSSKITDGGFVTYSNKAKIAIGVPKDIVDKYGVYSIQTAAFMALTCKEKLGADIGVGITGTFSNTDPVNNDSIPGVVHFCIAFNKSIEPTKMDGKIVDKLAESGIPMDKLYVVSHEMNTSLLNASRDKQKQFMVTLILDALWKLLKGTECVMSEFVETCKDCGFCEENR